MRGRLTRVGVAGVGVAFVLAGCGGNETGGQPTVPSSSKQSAPSSSSTAPSSGADAESVAWMDGFCGEVIKITSIKDIGKPETKPGDVAGTHKAISDYLGKLHDRLASFLQGLEQLPPGPVPEADKAVQNLKDIFVPAANKIKDVKTKLDAADPTDKQAILDAVNGVKSFAKEIQNVDNPLKVLKGSGLEPALKKAPNCKKLGA